MTSPFSLILLFLFSLMLSCGNQESSETTQKPGQTEENVIKADPKQDSALSLAETPPDLEEPVLADPVLHKVERFREFSQAGKKDHFMLTATGDSMPSAWVHLKIFNAEGDEIYSIDFESWNLVDYGIMVAKEENPAITEAEYMISRLDSFFVESTFSQPAIGPKDKFYEDMSDRIIWEEIKANPQAIGYFYRLGIEDGRSLAWSSKQSKVVMYLNCC